MNAIFPILPPAVPDPVFECRHLNTTDRWYVGVRTGGEVIDTDKFSRQLMMAMRIDARTVRAYADVLYHVLLGELRQGNTVTLFDIVRFTPTLAVDCPSSESEAEIGSLMSGLSARDVRVSVNATPCVRLRKALRQAYAALL